MASTEQALCYGAITGLALACVGVEAPLAALAGGTVVAAALLLHVAISHAIHHGRVHEPPQPVRRRPPKVHLPKATGFHRGAFGRL